MWDIFISHASEDKDEIARPLAVALEKQGLSVWFDEMTLKLGDSLRSSIAEGLRDSRYGIIILSPNFFKKKWTQYELDGLVTREMTYGEKTILPIWHNINQRDIMRFSPALANKMGVSTDQGLDEVVRQILDVVMPNTFNQNASYFNQPASIFEETSYNLSFPSRPSRKSIDKRSVAQVLMTYFNLSELNGLCFDLGIDIDDLAGTTTSDKARELASYMDRRGRLPELATYIREIRPNTDL